MRRKLENFWQRMSDGVTLQQLWAQFSADARSSYQFYSKEVDSTVVAGESRWHRFSRIVRGLFWAMMMKLSPGRRVLLLIALVLWLFPDIHITHEDQQVDTLPLHFFSGAAFLILLALELSDRVTMKRDLEIAREIQSWLMPSEAPKVPGVEIAFASRPANTVVSAPDCVRRQPASSESPQRWPRRPKLGFGPNGLAPAS